MDFGNEIKQGNIVENWLFDITTSNLYCLNFDGSDDYVDFGDILATYTSFTIEAWVRTTTTLGTQTIVTLGYPDSPEASATNTSFSMTLMSGGDLRIFWEYNEGYNEDEYDDNYAISTDTWTHVCLTRNDSDNKVRFYKNGALTYTSNPTTDPDGGESTSMNLRIGASQKNLNNFNGDIAQLRIFNIARSDTEIANSYNTTIPSSTQGLVADWRMDEGSGTQVTDSSNSGNNGTISGATWVQDFDKYNTTFHFAFQDVIDSGNFYHGVILNKPSIRESIDLANSTAKSSNMSISIPDFTYQGSPISEELFGGSNHYINQVVSVHSIVGSGSKIQIGSFRLTDISSNGDTLQLSLTSHRPWDFISFPQNKHPEYGVYEPVVYGEFSPANNANSTDIPTATRRVYPVPVLYNSSTKIYTVMPRPYTSSDNAFIHYSVGFNQFVPLRLAEAVYTETSNRVDSITSTTIDNSGLNILGSRVMQSVSGVKYGSSFEGYITTAPSDRETAGSLQFFSNQENMFQWNTDGSINTSTSSDAVYNDSSGETFYALVQTPKKNFHIEYIRGVLLGVKLEASDGTLDNDQNFIIDFFSNQFDSITDELLNPNVQRAYNTVYGYGTGSYSTGTGVLIFNEPAANSIASIDGCMCPDELLFKCSSIASGIREDNTFKLVSMQLHYVASLPTFDGDGGSLSAVDLSIEKDMETLGSIQYFYCGGDGLEKSYNGGSGVVQYIHEAHRDLINIFAGVDDTDANIDGWSSLNTSKTQTGKEWKIRWWQLEPIELKKALEQLQYEGGFIFRFKADGKPQYIHIPDSPTVDKTLTKADISNVSVRPSPLSESITKMDINYQKHPTGESYYSSQESSNNSARVTWNIQTKENTKQVNLDAYVSPTIPTTPSTYPNDDFYTYYDNIFGDIKMMVSCTIVNPAFYDLEVGDIVDFSDMYPEKPFGYNSGSWSGLKFMITSLNRTLGELKIETREI